MDIRSVTAVKAAAFWKTHRTSVGDVMLGVSLEQSPVSSEVDNATISDAAALKCDDKARVRLPQLTPMPFKKVEDKGYGVFTKLYLVGVTMQGVAIKEARFDLVEFMKPSVEQSEFVDYIAKAIGILVEGEIVRINLNYTNDLNVYIIEKPQVNRHGQWLYLEKMFVFFTREEAEKFAKEAERTISALG